MGLTIYHRQYLSVDFTILFYKKLLNKPLEFSDMKFIDPEIYKNINWLRYETKFNLIIIICIIYMYNMYKKNFFSFLYKFNLFFLLLFNIYIYGYFIILYRENNGAENLCLNFTINIEDCFGNHKTVELKPNGANIDMTDSNKNEYIK